MEPIVLKAKKVRGICAAKGCTNKSPDRQLCSTCRCRKARQEDPVRYAYDNLKHNARRRGKAFTLTLEEFRTWCRKVRYMASKGRTLDSYDVDRIIESEGYHIWNIQKLRKDKNIRKYHQQKVLQYDYQTRHAKVWLGRREAVPAVDDPF